MKASEPESLLPRPEWQIIMTTPEWNVPLVIFHWNQHRAVFGKDGWGRDRYIRCRFCQKFAPEALAEQYEKLYRLMTLGQ